MATDQTRFYGGMEEHFDDFAHRMELRDLFRAALRATGPHKTHYSFQSDHHFDWRGTSIVKWADMLHYNVEWVFSGLEVPDELKVGPPGETNAEKVARAKQSIAAVRVLREMSKLDVDRLMNQTPSVHYQWERRISDFSMATMQKVTRAFGGVFRVELTHKYNSGLIKRMESRMG